MGKAYFFGIIVAIVALSVWGTAKALSPHAQRADVRMERIKIRRERPNHVRWRERRQEAREAGRRFSEPEPPADEEVTLTVLVPCEASEATEDQAMFQNLGTILLMAAIALGVLIWVLPLVSGKLKSAIASGQAKAETTETKSDDVSLAIAAASDAYAEALRAKILAVVGDAVESAKAQTPTATASSTAATPTNATTTGV